MEKGGCRDEERHKKNGWQEKKQEGRSSLNLVFDAITSTLDDHRLGMVKEPVEQGGGEGTVNVEDLGPLFESAIGGNDKRAALVAPAGDLEEEVCLL